MPKTVVNVLEVIDGRDQQYKGWGTAFAAADLTIKHFSHVMAIERAGQRVTFGHVFDRAQ